MRRNRHNARFGALAFTMALVMASCSTSKNARNTAPADEMSDEDILDEEVTPTDVDQKPTSDDLLSLPTPSESPAIELDGENSDWEDKALRAFDKKTSVQSGKRFWKSKKDASLKLGARADEGWVYFWLEAADDKVIEEDDENGDPVDGIVLWLRDPNLESLLTQLPAGVELEEEVTSEIALLFTPDGQVRRFDGAADDVQHDAIQSAPFVKKGGWGVEVAIRLEALPFAFNLPMSDVAFRVDMLDGDDPKRLGIQTTFTMLPTAANEPAKFARLSTPGLLPHHEARGALDRPEGFGYWSQDGAQWTYNSLEVQPRYWKYVKDPTEFAEIIKENKVFSRICNKATYDQRLTAVMSSRSDKHRVGLFVCASREVEGECKSGAKARIFWVHLRDDREEGWTLENAMEMTEKGPLTQCISSAPANEAYLDGLSMIPLDVIDTNLWVIGWRKTLEQDDYTAKLHGAWLFNAKQQHLFNDIITYKSVADGNEREFATTSPFFIEVDKVQGYDLCEVEHLREQHCQAHNQRCETYGAGESKQVFMRMWVPKAKGFEPYMLATHPMCKGDLTFNERKGYLLVHTGSKLGLIPSAKNNEGTDEPDIEDADDW